MRGLLKLLVAATTLCFGLPAVAWWQSVPQQSAGTSYTGPGDIVSSASGFWGLRGYNAAFNGAVANICDNSTGAVCADVTWAAGVLTFPTIGGVACNNTTKCEIKTLYDQSGSLACAASTNCDVTRAHGTRPILIMPAASNGCPTDSFPCISFSGAQCLKSTNNLTLSQPFSAITTFKNSGASGYNGVVFGPEVTDIRLPGANHSATNQITVYAGGTPAVVTATDGNWHAAQSVVNNTTSSSNADSSGSGSVSVGTRTFSAEKIDLGSNSNSSANCNDGRPFNGTAVEWGLWGVAFSTGNITSLNSNAHSYWGF